MGREGGSGTAAWSSCNRACTRGLHTGLCRLVGLLCRAVQAKGAGYAISRQEELATCADAALATGVVLDPVCAAEAGCGCCGLAAGVRLACLWLSKFACALGDRQMLLCA